MTNFQPLRSGAFSADTSAVCIGSGRFLVRVDCLLRFASCIFHNG